MFPCHGVDEQGECSCRKPDCDREGKHPQWEKGTLEHGKDDATSDERQVFAWAAKWPQANWAFVPLSLSWVVIDMDGEQGQQAFKALPGYQELPKTYTVKTGRQGGYHAYLALPAGVTVKEGDLVERVLTAKSKGYVMLAGCGHKSGRRYTANEPLTPVAPCPPWLLARLAQEQEPQATQAEAAAGSVPKTSRHNLLMTRAAQLRNKKLSEEEILACLRASNDQLKEPKPEKELRDIAQWISSKPEQAKGKSNAEDAPVPSQPPAPPPQLTIPAAEIADGIVRTFRRFVVLSPSQACILALWVMHCHALDAADITPYVNITSAEKQSGKTRLLETAQRLVPRPWLTGSVSAAVLFRTIEEKTPTLLLDESDAAFSGDKEYAEGLRGVLNTGNDREGVASRCERQGSNFVARDFATFCPKAIAGIGDRLPDTVRDRSIPIRLRRKGPGEHVERFRKRKVTAELKPLADRAAAWALQNVGALRQAEPSLPDELSDRQQDGAEPLLAIADAIGGDWSARARAALAELFASTIAKDQSIGVQLLAGVREIFGKAGNPPRLASAELQENLMEIDGAPWSEWKDGKPITKSGIARLLKPYDIHPGTVRDGKDTFKGYYRESFEDAWSRYLRPDSPNPLSQTVTPSQPAQTLAATASQSVTPKAAVTVPKSEENPLPERSVTVVTVAGRGNRPKPGLKVVEL